MGNQHRGVTMETREIPSYPGYYVTSNGNVIGKRGNVLKGKITWDGYREVILSDGKKRRSVRVHILVTEVFLGEKPEGYVVNHKDCNKLNNDKRNLEYTTVGDNTRHAVINGKIKCKGIPASSLKREDLEAMRMMRQSGYSYREVRDFFNMECRPDYIGELISGRKLSQISGFDSNSTFRGHYVGSSDPKLSAP